MINRAYSLLEVKAVDEEKRIIEGIATTPSPDRMDDVVVSEGIEFKLPLPLLNQHRSSEPIGNVIEAKVTKAGIRIKAQLAPAGLLPYIDQAWTQIKAGLVRGLSIGFRSLEHSFNDDTGGINFLRTEWMELSAVTIPANADASILTVKSLDIGRPAAIGNRPSPVVKLGKTTPPGVSGTAKGHPMKIREQITSFENKRAASEARMTAIMEKSGDEGRTLDETEQQEYDNLDAEVKEIDAHLVRMKAQEARNVANAQKVNTGTATDPAEVEKPGTQRGRAIEVKSMLPKGIGIARMAICMLTAKGIPQLAVQMAKERYPDQPELHLYMKSVVEAGDTTTSGWASQLLPAASTLPGEFLDMLRPLTILGKLPLREVPFNISVPLQSGGGTYGWVGEGAPKPVTSPTYGSATLRFEKAAGIIVITQELARFSNPSAELLVRDELLNGLTRFYDTAFVSTTAAVSNVSPAGILNGISSTAVTGTTAAKFRVDMNTIIQNFITNNQDPATAVILMSTGQAMALSSMITSLGIAEFPTINAQGGSYNGIPIVASQNVGQRIVLIQPRDILHASDPAIRIDASTETSIEMDTLPAQGEQSAITTVSVLKSMFQNNMVALRAEQFNTWKVARTTAVEYLTLNAYVPS
jgi:HK97 family phage prohead protease